MKYSYLFFIILTLISCNYNSTYSNRESDKNEAEKIPKKFYWEIQYGNSEEETFKLFSEKFFEVTDKNKLREIIALSNSQFGAIKEYNLGNWETFVVKGSNPKSEYVLIYDVIRENTKTQEKFSMVKENGVIKIVGYNVNQNLLDQ